MKLYVTRHGETVWNQENRVLGRTDIPLNENGINQAGQLAEQLSSVRLDRIYVSPLTRAVETGQIVAKRQESCIFAIEPCLIEMSYGVYEGVDRGDPQYQTEKRRYFSRYPGGESFFDVAARVYPFLQQLKAEGKDQNTLIVTHAGICRMIANYFIDMDNEEFIKFPTDNCEVREFNL